MSFGNVLTLIATPPHPALERKKIRDLMNVLGGHGATFGDPEWLAEGVAIDLPLWGLSAADAGKLAEAFFSDDAVDVVAQSQQGRRRKLLLIDMDGTIILQESLDELAAEAGIKDEVAALTAKAMRGEMDFRASLCARVRLLKGLPERALEATLPRLIVAPGAKTLIRTLQARGVDCHLVSGGFRYFTRSVAQHLGFTSEQGNELVIREGVLTGDVQTPVLDRDAKLTRLYELAALNGLSLAEVICVGDGTNDLPMLLAAGLGVAMHAKPRVNEVARTRIRYSDLTALLYAQGYARADFI